MNNAADDVNVKLYSVQKEERCVRIGFEDNVGGHDFRFFNLNLLRCQHLLINSVLCLTEKFSILTADPKTTFNKRIELISADTVTNSN